MKLFSMLLVIISFNLIAATNIEGYIFNTKAEYWNTGKPCACPSDLARNSKCGRRAALCKLGGKHILDCNSDKIQSFDDYRKVQQDLCGDRF